MKILVCALALVMLPVTGQTLCDVEVSVQGDGRSMKLDFGTTRNLNITTKGKGPFLKFKKGVLTELGKPVGELIVDLIDITYVYEEESKTFCGMWVEIRDGKHVMFVEEYRFQPDQQPKLLTESYELEGISDVF